MGGGGRREDGGGGEGDGGGGEGMGKAEKRRVESMCQCSYLMASNFKSLETLSLRVKIKQVQRHSN